MRIVRFPSYIVTRIIVKYILIIDLLLPLLFRPFTLSSYSIIDNNYEKKKKERINYNQKHFNCSPIIMF